MPRLLERRPHTLKAVGDLFGVGWDGKAGGQKKKTPKQSLEVRRLNAIIIGLLCVIGVLLIIVVVLLILLMNAHGRSGASAGRCRQRPAISWLTPLKNSAHCSISGIESRKS